MKIHEQGVILDTKTIITGVVTTLVVGGIVGAFGYSRVAESNSYRISTNASAIDGLSESKLDTNVYVANQEVINTKIDSLEEKLDLKTNDIIDSIDDLKILVRNQ